MTISTPVSMGHNENTASLTTSGNAAPSGSLIVVSLCSWGTNGSNFTGLSDNAGVGNTYTKAIQSSTSGLSASTSSIWYCSNSGGLPIGSILTPTGTNGSWSIMAVYCTGANGGNDAGTNVQAFSTTAVTSLTAGPTSTLANSSEILFGNGSSVDANMQGFTASGFTNLFAGTHALSYMIVSTNTAVSLAASWTNSGRNSITMAGFQATGGGGGGGSDDIVAIRSTLIIPSMMF